MTTGNVLGLLGAAVGSFFGQPALGYAAGSALGNAIDPPELPEQRVVGPRISDLKVQSSTYGNAIPRVYGKRRVAGNVIWAKDIREVAKTSTSTSGGKGGGPTQKTTTTTYSYFADFAVALCEGEGKAITKIWVNNQLSYNVTASASSATLAASSLFAEELRFYSGSETQTADSLIVADKGSLAPAYRGTCYVVIKGMDVTNYGGRIPNLEFEVVMAGTIAAPAVVSKPVFHTAAAPGLGSSSAQRKLGRLGNIYLGDSTIGRIRRVNFYSNSIEHTYPPGPQIVTCIDPRGEALCVGGSTIYVVTDDGDVGAFTGAVSSIGTNHGIGLDAHNRYRRRFFLLGDSINGANTYFVELIPNNQENLDEGGTYAATQLFNADGTPIRTVWFLDTVIGGANTVSGRIYAQLSDVSPSTPYIGYFDEDSHEFIPLWNPGFVPLLPPMIHSGTQQIWIRQTSAATNQIEVRDKDGVLVTTITVPTSAQWTAREDASGLVWLWANSQPAYAYNPTTYQRVLTSANIGSNVSGLFGFTEDNQAVLLCSEGIAPRTYFFKTIDRLGRVTATYPQLDSVVTDIFAQVGITAGDIDVTALTDQVKSYVIPRRMSARAAIEPLAQRYKFAVVESDNKIKCVKLGGTSVVTIPDEKLGAVVGDATRGVDILSVRRLETELPHEVVVTYLDIEKDYAIASQYARRLVGESSDPITIETALAMTSAEAAAMAEYQLYRSWADRHTVTLNLSREYSYLEPTDVITAGAYTLRIIQKDEADGVVTLLCVSEETDVYDTVSTGVSIPDVGGTVGEPGPTVLQLLDIPLLRDDDNGAGLYCAVHGYYDGWRGAELYTSVDGGATYAPLSTVFLQAAIVGSAATVLPNFLGGNVIDELSTVEVVVNGELSSTTSALLLTGANACYLAGELMNFRDATFLSTAGGFNRYRLTGFLRGRKGTTQYMSTHAIGDKFILLTTDTVRRLNLSTSDIGVSRLYKAPSIGMTLGDAAAYSITPAGVGLKPLAPVHLAGGRTAAASYDINITWVRQARVGATWRDGVDVPLDEATEDYVVEIYTNSTFTTLKRTITTTASAAGSVVTPSTRSAVYKSADQVTDFGSNQSEIWVKVYQLSAVVGRGFALSGSV